MKCLELSGETKSRVTTQFNCLAYFHSRLAERGETFSLSGAEMKRLMSTFNADLPGWIWAGFDDPDYKLELAPSFLADAFQPKIMGKRVEVLAATLSEPERSRMHAA